MPSPTAPKAIGEVQPTATATPPSIQAGQEGPIEAGTPKRGEWITVELLDRSSRHEALEVLAEAFVDEPALRHVLGGTARRRPRVLRPFMSSAFAGFPESIEVHGARLDGRLVGVALRFPPGGWPGTRSERLRMWTLGMAAMAPTLVVSPHAIHLFRHMTDIQGRNRLDRPHWFLWTMGAHLSLRRRCVASKLARYVTVKADADGAGCSTETFGDGTEALYRGLGFEVRERWEIEPGAPMARTMWRDPQPGGQR